MRTNYIKTQEELDHEEGDKVSKEKAKEDELKAVMMMMNSPTRYSHKMRANKV